MRELCAVDDLSRAEAAFRRAFGEGPWEEPFTDRLPCRMLLYPIDYVLLDRAQYDAVAAAARCSGAQEAYLGGVAARDRSWSAVGPHFVVSLCDYDDYRAPYRTGTLEHVLYALDGSWAVLTSGGDFAVVGGGGDFICQVKIALGQDEEKAVREFVDEYDGIGAAGGYVDWVPGLLDHVLGGGRGDDAGPQAPRQDHPV